MKHSSDYDSCIRIDVINDCMSEVQQRRLAKSYDLEDIEKCLEVQSYDEEGLIKYQNTVTPCESSINYKEKMKKCHDVSKRRKCVEIGNHMLF